MWLYVLYLFHTGNTVLFVAHASSLEACTRQIQGLNPQNSKDFVQVVRKVSVAFQFRRFFDFLCNFSLSQCFFWTTCTSVSSFVQIPYLGFCSCEEMGETGVWQLVDPPILPLTHGPNHSFNWREMLMQDWRICSLALLSWTAEQKVASIKRHHAKKKEKTKKKRINEGKCIQTHCSGMGMYSLCGDYRKMCYSLGGTLLHYPQRYTC